MMEFTFVYHFINSSGNGNKYGLVFIENMKLFIFFLINGKINIYY